MNTIIESIRGILQYFAPEKQFKNETKNQLKTFVEQLKNDDSFDIDNSIINELISILEKKTINKQIKETIKIKTVMLLKKLDENNKNCEVVRDPNEIKNIEKQLDNQIISYNKYTKENPMLGVTWNSKNKIWRIYNTAYNVNAKNKTLKLATELMKNKILLGTKNPESFLEICTLCFMSYQGKHIIVYNTQENPLFDILHIINLLDIADENDKYNDFKDKITHYCFKKNEHDGYIIKRFIPEETMYEIIMSSNSDFSKNFKTNVSKILCELRKTNQLTITNNEFIMTKPNYTKHNICDKEIKNNLDMILHNNIMEQTYDNPFYCNMVKVLIRDGAKIPLQKYAGNHILYFFIITITDFENKNRIFCKIGYTSDIISRIKSLRDEYKCELYLVGLKYIKNEQMEKEFHKTIKLTKKHLVYQMQINNRDKDEIYIFDEFLYNEFQSIEDNTIHNDNISIVDKFNEQFFKDQYQYFIKYLNSINSHHILTYIPIQANEYYKDMFIAHINTNSNNYALEMEYHDKDKEREFQLMLKDKDLMKMEQKNIQIKLKLQYIEKEIELKKIN